MLSILIWQLQISEVLGIFLAAFSITLPFIGKFLKVRSILLELNAMNNHSNW